MLQFLHDWLAADNDRLSDSLGGFVDNGAYDTVARFAPISTGSRSCSVEVTARCCSATNPSSGWAFMVVFQ